MTINHSIPHQQLLPNVTLLLIKIHPAARHWGTNDLEIGFSAPEGFFPQDARKLLQERKKYIGGGGSKAGKWGHPELCARHLKDRMCLTLMTIHFREGETEALGAESLTSEQGWRHPYSVCLDPALSSFLLRQNTRHVRTKGRKRQQRAA